MMMDVDVHEGFHGEVEEEEEEEAREPLVLRFPSRFLLKILAKIEKHRQGALIFSPLSDFSLGILCPSLSSPSS